MLMAPMYTRKQLLFWETHTQEISIWRCSVPPRNTRGTDVTLLKEAQPAGQGAPGNVEDTPVLPVIYQRGLRTEAQLNEPCQKKQNDTGKNAAPDFACSLFLKVQGSSSDRINIENDLFLYMWWNLKWAVGPMFPKLPKKHVYLTSTV